MSFEYSDDTARRTETADDETDRRTDRGTDRTDSERGRSDARGDRPAPEVDRVDATEDDLDRSVRLELLAAENRRLRAEYARVRQSRYRRTAIGLAAIGLAAIAGGALFPGSREVLVAFGATGLFGSVLTYALAPERVVAADVGERVYAAQAANGAAIATELGLRDDRLYVPVAAGDGAELYVPAHADSEPPDVPDGPFVLEAAGRGLLLEATGGPLFREFRRTLTDEPATDPAALATQLCEALVEGFELADRARPDVDAATGRVTVAVANGAFGDVDRFDHPIASFVAVGLAAGLDRPVELSVDAGDERSDWLVTCRFEPPAEARDSTGRADGDADSSAPADA
ncbi:hypothetical protein [Halosolutus gelatinilyticus]|uniref:hypothetical protein n=1 Tax=Halosolutus gelatinilyticus TaxID=2931975 RepID=UPI001FF537F5|nr:hypothetical protein [Halosolutus gelatinilyticus]